MNKDSSVILDIDYNWQACRDSGWGSGTERCFNTLQLVKEDIEADRQWREKHKLTPVSYRIIKTTYESINYKTAV